MTSIERSDRKRLIQSGLFSLGIWIVIGAWFFLVPVSMVTKKIPHYEAVHLTLAVKAPLSMPDGAAIAKSAPSAALPAVAPSAKKSSLPAKTGLAGAAVRKSTSEKSAVKASAGLGIPNFSTPVSSPSSVTSAAGDSLDFSSANEPSRPTAPKGSNPVAELEGSAASVSASRSSGRVVRSGPGSGASGSGGSSAASGETRTALGEIAGTAKAGGGGTGSGPAVKGASGTGDSGTAGSGGIGSGASGRGSSVGGLSFDGVARKLLYPSNPSIVLPENLARLVDSSRSVTVSFTVRPDGTVPSGLVSFTPSAILPAEIRDYLRKEFSEWRFEKSSEDGQARFLYSIRVE